MAITVDDPLILYANKEPDIYSILAGSEQSGLLFSEAQTWDALRNWIVTTDVLGTVAVQLEYKAKPLPDKLVLGAHRHDDSGFRTAGGTVSFQYWDGAAYTDAIAVSSKTGSNEMLYSEQLDNAYWSLNNGLSAFGAGSAVNAILAQDNELTAELIVDSTISSGNHFIASGVSVSAGIDYTISVFVKRAAGTTIFPMIAGIGIGGAGEKPIFNLEAGTVDLGATSTIVKDAGMIDFGGGWFRIWARVNSATAASGLGFGHNVDAFDNANTGHVYTGDGTSGFYWGGAQLSPFGLTPYLKTTSQAITAATNIISEATNEPSLHALASSSGVVISEVNELRYSEEFDNAAWLGSGTILVTANTDTSPDGTATADNLEDTSTTSFGASYQAAATFEASEAYTASVFIKKDTVGRATRFPMMRLRFAGSTSELNDIAFDTSTGEFKDTGVVADPNAFGKVEDYSADYWRVSITAASQDAANTRAELFIYPAVGASSAWVYSASAVGSVVAWGAQIDPYTSAPYTKTTAAAKPWNGASTWDVYVYRLTLSAFPALTDIALPEIFLGPSLVMPGIRFNYDPATEEWTGPSMTTETGRIYESALSRRYVAHPKFGFIDEAKAAEVDLFRETHLEERAPFWWFYAPLTDPSTGYMMKHHGKSAPMPITMPGYRTLSLHMIEAV